MSKWPCPGEMASSFTLQRVGRVWRDGKYMLHCRVTCLRSDIRIELLATSYYSNHQHKQLTCQKIQECHFIITKGHCGTLLNVAKGLVSLFCCRHLSLLCRYSIGHLPLFAVHRSLISWYLFWPRPHVRWSVLHRRGVRCKLSLTTRACTNTGLLT